MRSKLLLINVIVIILYLNASAQTSSVKNHSSLKGWKNKTNRQLSQNKSIDLNEVKKVSENIFNHRSSKSLAKTTNQQNSLSSVLRNKDRKPIDLNKIKLKSSAKNFKINWDEKNNTPIALYNNFSGQSLGKAILSISAYENAITFIKENKELFKLQNPFEELILNKEITDNLNMHHIVFDQKYKGIPIWGKEMVVHLNSAGEIYSVNARYSKTPTDIDVHSKKIEDNEAVKIAKQSLLKFTKIENLDKNLKKLLKYDEPTAEQYIWTDETNKNHLVWFVTIRPNLKDNWYYFVDANNGDILEKYNAAAADGPATTTAKDLLGINRSINVYLSSGAYYLLDASRDMWRQGQTDPVNNPLGGILTLNINNQDLSNTSQIYFVTSNNNSWNDATSISAHYNSGITYQYYLEKHGRDGIDGNGSTMISIIHATEDGQPMDNAYWNGAFMVYGDGNSAFYPLATAVDVAAHEMTHGVIEHTVGLEYKNQSGALNESLADVFGAMVDKEDWYMGEDVTKTSYIPTGVLRNMLDPHNGGTSIYDNGWQPSNMNEFLNLTIDQDNGGVHINSGIPNRACALIGEAIGKDKTEKIYYRILDARYLNSQSQFIDMRLAAIRSATDLFGESSAEVNAVKNAFDTVGIFDGSGTKPPSDIPAVEGEQWIAAVNAETNDSSLYLIRPTIQSNSDIVQLTSTQIYTGTGNPISITDDGSYILFIDADNYIRGINNNGSGESVLSQYGEWNSIAISPDGTKLAATSIYYEPNIYIFDLENSNNSFIISLYNPTTQDGVEDNSVKYADALDWDINSEIIVYDCYNEVPQATGGNIDFWTINIYDMNDGNIYNLFPPQQEGISIGNPSFSQTNSGFLLLDLIDFNNGTDDIYAIDLFSGNANVVESNGSSIGYPRYSPDDTKIVFQRLNNTNTPSLRLINLMDDKITAAASSQDYVVGGRLPNWFAVGSRPVSVEDQNSNSVPQEFYLGQNYPNPFNPNTQIEFSLPQKSFIKLKIYDALGKEISNLIDGEKSAGKYKVNFNANGIASGIYMYRLETEGFTETRKMILIK